MRKVPNHKLSVLQSRMLMQLPHLHSKTTTLWWLAVVLAALLLRKRVPDCWIHSPFSTYTQFKQSAPATKSCFSLNAKERNKNPALVTSSRFSRNTSHFLLLVLRRSWAGSLQLVLGVPSKPPIVGRQSPNLLSFSGLNHVAHIRSQIICFIIRWSSKGFTKTQRERLVSGRLSVIVATPLIPISKNTQNNWHLVINVNYQ